jgi:hypothetical protein
LCALEILAGGREWANDYISIPIEVPDDLPCPTLSMAELSEGWDAAEHSNGTRELGTAWAAAKETVVLVVPSAVLPREATTRLIRNTPIFRAWLSRKPSLFHSTGD